MEQLFEPAVLNTKINGRKLDLSGKETDATKFYSKNEFSIEVIRKHEAAINFNGFKPLLNIIVSVQKDYAAKVAAGTVS